MQTMTAEVAFSQIHGQADKIKTSATQRFPDAASFGDSHRQGDVYITLMDPALIGRDYSAMKVRPQLADGDTAGSRHCLEHTRGVTMYEKTTKGMLDGPVIVIGEQNTVTHPEHGHVILPPGAYAITYQRNLDSMEREARVLD